MTIHSKQKVYRVQGPDGLWAKKTGSIKKIAWVVNEHSATFWRKLHHLKRSLNDGVFSDPAVLEDLPLASLRVVEYEVTIERTGKKHRITELNKFYPEKIP